MNKKEFIVLSVLRTIIYIKISTKMKTLLINIKNLFPYLFLIAVYFIFVNIEATRDNITVEENVKINIDNNSEIKKVDLTIPIPVIPYDQ